LNTVGDPNGNGKNQTLVSIEAEKILGKWNHMEYEIKFSENDD
jgi:hypothetical protein